MREPPGRAALFSYFSARNIGVTVLYWFFVIYVTRGKKNDIIAMENHMFVEFICIFVHRD